jgi:hypothetical protein
LKAFVDGVTVKRFEEAARNGEIAQLRTMLKQRPELVNSSALRYAVLRRDHEMVTVLMEHGADARTGVYPHRDATTPLVIATDRGYGEIVAMIKEAEQRRREISSGSGGTADPAELSRAIASGENDRAISLLESDPSLIQARLLRHERTPLHVAAARLNVKMVDWLIQRGADVNAKGRNWTQQTPLDSAAHSLDASRSAEFADVANRLARAGAAMTPWAAVALGDTGWLMARHAQGTLFNPIEGSGGMLRIAGQQSMIRSPWTSVENGWKWRAPRKRTPLQFSIRRSAEQLTISRGSAYFAERSKRSRFMTLLHAATKSFTNFS